MGEHRLVPTDEVLAFITHLERQVSHAHHATKIHLAFCDMIFQSTPLMGTSVSQTPGVGPVSAVTELPIRCTLL